MSKTTKQCTRCNNQKNITEFHKNSQRKDGIVPYCRECISKYKKEYRRTKKGLVSKIYETQIQNSRSRGHHLPTYTKQELKEWMYSQNIFHTLYDNWKRLDYQHGYIPSVDRINDYLGYTMSNIQIMTWQENNDKGCRDRVIGKNNKINKAVSQHDLNGVFIAEYHSISEAARETGVTLFNISACCLGKRNTAGKFRWQFKETV